MSANYVDFDPELQALGYRAKTWDWRHFRVVSPTGEDIDTMCWEEDIASVARQHYERALEAAQALKKPLIEIWRFDDTPKDLRDLSPHGGDEDWVVIVRDEDNDNSIVWQLEGGRFMSIDHWTKHEYNGETIWIGAHS